MHWKRAWIISIISFQRTCSSVHKFTQVFRFAHNMWENFVGTLFAGICTYLNPFSSICASVYRVRLCCTISSHSVYDSRKDLWEDATHIWWAGESKAKLLSWFEVKFGCRYNIQRVRIYIFYRHAQAQSLRCICHARRFFCASVLCGNDGFDSSMVTCIRMHWKHAFVLNIATDWEQMQNSIEPNLLSGFSIILWLLLFLLHCNDCECIRIWKVIPM